MLESYKLKKAKAKLELESVNKQLAEIKAKKENERWEQMPQWERNIETEIVNYLALTGEASWFVDKILFSA